jgi:hypothetical protein
MIHFDTLLLQMLQKHVDVSDSVRVRMGRLRREQF